jgi:hypothetical protein
MTPALIEAEKDPFERRTCSFGCTAGVGTVRHSAICEYRGDYCGVAMTVRFDRVRDVLGEELAELSLQRGFVESTDRDYSRAQLALR